MTENRKKHTFSKVYSRIPINTEDNEENHYCDISEF